MLCGLTTGTTELFVFDYERNIVFQMNLPEGSNLAIESLTGIFKISGEDYPYLATNEYFRMTAAKELELAVRDFYLYRRRPPVLL